MAGQDDRLAVITGAAGGMGAACARRLAKDGYALLLTDFKAEPLEATAKALRAGGASVETLAGDIADPAFSAALAAKVGAGRLGALVHTAGLSPAMSSPERIMTVNLDATLRLVEVMAPLAGPGTVAVLFASTAGHMSSGPEADAAFDAPLKPGDAAGLTRFFPTPEAAYILSKRAVKRLAERQASAWGQRGARIVSISPGIIDTPMGQLEMQNQPAITAMLGITPLPRQGTVEEIAGPVAFLCSSDAGYVTGVDLRIDGGVTAAMSAG